MGRIIYGPIDDISVTNDADQNIFVLTAGANDKIKLHGFEITSAKTAAEILRLQLRRETTAGAGGAVVEAKADEADGAITATMVTLDLTPGTPGDVLMGFQWEQLGPLGHVWTPKMSPLVQEAGIIVLHLETALAATTNMSGWVCWEEI